MSTIKISELSPVGSELFSDDENFMGDLTASEFTNVKGGFTWTALVFVAESSAPCGGVVGASVSSVAYTIWGKK